MIEKPRDKDINYRYVPLEFSSVRRADWWHEIDETRNPPWRQWYSRNGVTPLTNRTCTHAFITFWKLGEASPLRGEGGCKVLSSFVSRQILPLSRSKMARESRKKEKGEERGRGR